MLDFRARMRPIGNIETSKKAIQSRQPRSRFDSASLHSVSRRLLAILGRIEQVLHINILYVRLSEPRSMFTTETHPYRKTERVLSARFLQEIHRTIHTLDLPDGN